MENKTYLVLTPEKIEDIFRDLESTIEDLNLLEIDLFYIRIILESKKQELLKSIK